MDNMVKFSYYNFYIPIEENNKYLIYNSLHNSLIEMDWNIGYKIANLNSEEIHFLPDQIRKTLFDNGNIINGNEDEFSIVNSRANRKRDEFKKGSEVHLVIAPTNLCNMQCIYCYEGEKQQRSKISTNDLQNTLQQIINQKQTKSVSILWFGGEPLMDANSIDIVSQYVQNLCNEKSIKYKSNIITNGTLLSPKNWDILWRNRILKVQVTLDGPSIIHNKKRLFSEKNGFDLILNNLSKMPNDDFRIIIRINGDKEIFKALPELFHELYDKKIWPHKYKNIKLDWALKFFDNHGHNENKDIYYTSYEYQESKYEFAKLKLHYLNKYCKENSLSEKKIKVMYPILTNFYCGNVEVPSNSVIDGDGNCYKCYNSIGRESEKINIISNFDIKSNEDFSLNNFDRTLFSDCKSCKILPICQEHCNYRLMKKNQSMVCCHWKYFLKERIKEYYLQSNI